MKHTYQLTITLPDDADLTSSDVSDEVRRALNDQVRPSLRNYITNDRTAVDTTILFELVPSPRS
jgi:hypothetical protein